MTITLRIDRIVLDGLAVGPGDVAALREALMSELTTLLSLSRAPRRSVYRSRATGEPVDYPRGQTALGRDVARSIHAACQRPPR